MNTEKEHYTKSKCNTAPQVGMPMSCQIWKVFFPSFFARFSQGHQ